MAFQWLVNYLNLPRYGVSSPCPFGFHPRHLLQAAHDASELQRALELAGYEVSGRVPGKKGKNSMEHIFKNGDL